MIAIDIISAITPLLVYLGLIVRFDMQIGSTILVGCVLALVVAGFAAVQLSGSPSTYGSFRVKTVSITILTANPRRA